MGSDLRLTGLASGMDWEPIVQKLLELEAIPKKRLESQKSENEAKVSDLGVLKSQLDSLKSASSALQDESLFNARSVHIKNSNSGLVANASTGALTGNFSITVESLASSTEISSKNRTSQRLASPIDLSDKLSDLPLHSPVTTGTFTISGKTFNISSTDMTLQELMDQINTTDSGVSGVNPEGDSSGVTISYDAGSDKMLLDTGISANDSSNLLVLGSSTDSSNFLQSMKLLGDPQSGQVESNYALGSIDMTVSLANANFAGAFAGLTSGMGNFFIGEGEGAVRIDYDVNNDSLAHIINRVNDSSANVFMYYDPVGDRFVARNERTGTVGIVMHESEDWDSISSANRGSGNILALMGLAAPKSIATEYDNTNLANYTKGDFVEISADGTKWQAMSDNPTEPPSAESEQWLQVIEGVARSMSSEIGENSSIRVNGGDLVYSNRTEFSSSEHGFAGISFDIAQVSLGASIEFQVSKDASAAEGAIKKLVEEFNDAQEYISSLTTVNQDGDEVTSSRFTGNQEISRLGSELRRKFFGNSTPHSESGTTVDNSNLTVSSNNASNDEINAIATQLGLSTSDDGYIIKVLNQDPSGEVGYFEWDGSSSTWSSTTPSFSIFRMTNIGLDFGIGSNTIKIEDSSLLMEELENNPDRVFALFSEPLVEDAYDTITETNRNYEGITQSLNDYIGNFLSGDSETGYKGAYQAFLDSIASQNDRIDEKIINIDKYLESREKILSDGFMRMEEMQSKMDSQMQTLEGAFNNNKK
ncbi:flagellar filament capping protein FliD [Opitutales bacterium]|nr:flagellar filament capping protein FliD [Opitutales bacterium]